MKTYVSLLLGVLFSLVANAQSMVGNLSLLTNQTIRLEGLHGLNAYSISRVAIDEKGEKSVRHLLF